MLVVMEGLELCVLGLIDSLSEVILLCLDRLEVLVLVVLFVCGCSVCRGFLWLLGLLLRSSFLYDHDTRVSLFWNGLDILRVELL